MNLESQIHRRLICQISIYNGRDIFTLTTVLVVIIDHSTCSYYSEHPFPGLGYLRNQFGHQNMDW